MDARGFIRGLRVELESGKRVVFCDACRRQIKRSIVPHLKSRHPDVWSAAVEDWLSLKDSGLTYRRIMKEYTGQEGQYILSWTVIKREVKSLAERQNKTIRAKVRSKVRSWKPDPEAQLDTTVWSFPQRGNWAVHGADYEGNWSPYVPRELIRQYSRKGDLVLDPFVGGGTTLIECALLGRRGLGLDVNPQAVAQTKQRLEELGTLAHKALDKPVDLEALKAVSVRRGDARDLSDIADSSVDLICTHPPYGAAIQYTTAVDGDLSLIKNTKDFMAAMEAAAREFRRVLKPKGYCAILIGDHRKAGELEPFGFQLFQRFTEKVGFKPIEVIIKLQHQDSSTEFYFGKKHSLRYRIAHEYLFVFRNERPTVPK